MKHTKLWLALVLFATITLSCEDDDYGNDSPPPAAPQETNAVSSKVSYGPLEEKILRYTLI